MTTSPFIVVFALYNRVTQLDFTGQEPLGKCPKCGGAKHSYTPVRRIFQCSACRKQTSARAGTIFHKSSTPLTKWFLAMHLLTSAKNDISSLELSRQIGVKWDTAWLIKQKLMEAMRQRNSIYRLDGDVQVDDAYLGGARSGGKRGRNSPGKVPFVAAVETIGDRTRVLAGVDCGFGTFAGSQLVEESVVWTKLRTLREGADLATARLWR